MSSIRKQNPNIPPLISLISQKIYFVKTCTRASLVAKLVKNLPAKQETQVQSLGQEDSLEKEMVTHSSILAWSIPWTEEPGRLQSMGLQESDRTERLTLTWWSQQWIYIMATVTYITMKSIHCRVYWVFFFSLSSCLFLF